MAVKSCEVMNSLDRKLLKKAFRIIRRNYGCPGIDGISISDVRRHYARFEIEQIARFENGTFVGDSLPKKVEISDYLGKRRKIFVYSVLERWSQEFIKLKLSPFVENALADCVYAFRQNKSDLDSYTDIIRGHPNHILRIDIKDFFDSTDRTALMQQLEDIFVPHDIIGLVRQSLAHYPTGLPQGNVLSCMLSNLSLTDFDKLFPINYTRFGDDMMFACESRAEVFQCLGYATKHLQARGFSVNGQKTRILTKPTFEELK
jgi:RNA-directed DNA polymerase